MDDRGIFAGEINKISAIKVIDKHFDYETMESDANIWVTELSRDKVGVYRKRKGQRERLFQNQVSVRESEMTSFFHRVYDFVRTAEYADVLCDDTDHRIEIIYNNYHKEVILNELFKGSEGLHSMIDRYIESTGITTFEKHMSSWG